MKKNENINDFEPIVRSTMTEVVEEKIRDYLKRRNLKPGDSIPREIEIAESLGVSRNVIREALSRFRMLGIIETKKKRGMVLSKPDIFNGLERVLDPNLLGDDTLIDIFEMRLVLEMGMAELLFTHKTEEGIKKLEKILKNKNFGGNTTFILKHEVEFHSQLYEITANRTLHRFQKLLLPIFQYVIDVESHLGYPPKVGEVDHYGLVEILKNGDPITFRKGMYAHLKPHFEWISKYKNK